VLVTDSRYQWLISFLMSFFEELSVMPPDRDIEFVID
jgi:hypothetical protein